MKILIEGPRWMGRWSEIVDEALSSLGHKTLLYYHNIKPFSFRLRRLVPTMRADVNDFSNAQLVKIGSEYKPDLLFSIQGKLDDLTVNKLREKNPNLKIIYWFGDVLSGRARQRIQEVYPFVDKLLISYYDDFLEQKQSLGSKVVYFPFGVSQKFHQIKSCRFKAPRGASVDVAFVGTHYPERDKILSEIIKSRSYCLKVWGRGWRRSKHVKSSGRLSMEQTLSIHRSAKVSLNIHHHLTRNGFNMKFFEIPAVGGFQICDWQNEIDRLNLTELVATFKDVNDLFEKLNYYLSRETLMEDMSQRFQAHVFENFRYDLRLNHLIESLGKKSNNVS